MNGPDKQDSIIAFVIYRTRISCHARAFQVMYSTLRSAGPTLPFTIAHDITMHSEALFFQPVAHGNDLRLLGMMWGRIRMDVSRKNERHIVTLLAPCGGLRVIRLVHLGLRQSLA